MTPDELATSILLLSLLCAAWGGYVAGVCDRGTLEGVLHGLFLGPIGLLLIALYGIRWRPVEQPHKELLERINTIHAELVWQRQQKEKEIHRQKAAQAPRST